MHIPFTKKKVNPADVTFMEDMRLDLTELLLRKGFTTDEALATSRKMMQAVDKKKLMNSVL